MKSALDRILTLAVLLLALQGIFYIAEKKRPADIETKKAQARYLLQQYGYTPAQINQILQ